MGIMNCPDCDGKVSNRVATCPHCGCPDPQRNQTTMNCPECSKEIDEHAKKCPHCGKTEPKMSGEIRATLLNSMMGPKCPKCGGFMQKMDAGSRGTAFGSGNLLGAFMNSHRCGACGHLS